MLIDVIKIAKNCRFGEIFLPISFSLNNQKMVAFVGGNGCGKSTFFKNDYGKRILLVVK